MYDNFFGLGTCDSAYDIRRHINLIFQGLMIDCSENSDFINKLQQKRNIRKEPVGMIAQWIIHDILAPHEIMFLNGLARHKKLPQEELIYILGFGTIDYVTKSPAGYNKKQNISILTHLCCLRNTMYGLRAQQYIQYILHFLQSFKMSVTHLESIYEHTTNAMEFYSPFRDIDKIEDYVDVRIQDVYDDL